MPARSIKELTERRKETFKYDPEKPKLWQFVLYTKMQPPPLKQVLVENVKYFWEGIMTVRYLSVASRLLTFLLCPIVLYPAKWFIKDPRGPHELFSCTINWAVTSLMQIGFVWRLLNFQHQVLWIFFLKNQTESYLAPILKYESLRFYFQKRKHLTLWRCIYSLALL